MSNEKLAMSNESNNDLIEIQILEKIRGLLTNRVNEILENRQLLLQLFELSEFKGRSTIVPMITLSGCERTEKERIIQQDAYSMTISFSVHETVESELYCYGYLTAVCKAMGENPTLGGIVDRINVTGKKVIPPKKANCGMDWEVTINLRITVETMSNEQ
jgi:hypothetical protein